MTTTLINLTVSLTLYVVAPLVVYLRYKKDPFVLLFGFFSLATLNTTIMALIRDAGGMEWLSKIGREPWFRQQYEVSYWCHIIASVCLIIFLLRLERAPQPTS
jgi:hypothetical protein